MIVALVVLLTAAALALGTALGWVVRGRLEYKVSIDSWWRGYHFYQTHARKLELP